MTIHKTFDLSGKFKLLAFISLALALINSGCNKTGSSISHEGLLILNDTLPRYDLENPVEKHVLPSSLREISGLSYYKDEIVASVQDEIGKIYFYDLSKKEIIHTIIFGNDGDYEGVEVVGETIYVTKSNGNLYQLDFNLQDKKQIATKIKTEFTIKNDIEGLGYDPILKCLLIITKEEGGIVEKAGKGSRGLYSFDLNKLQLNAKPLYLISKKERRAFYTKEVPEANIKEKDLHFMPSGIAVHPLNGNYYIIASSGKTLLVITPNGQIIESHPIEPKILNQPEGICFSADGTMYISSEGNDGPGIILKFGMN